MKWDVEKIIERQAKLIAMEKIVQNYYISNKVGFSVQENKLEIVELESKKNTILEEKEAMRRLKSRAIWV